MIVISVVIGLFFIIIQFFQPHRMWTEEKLETDITKQLTVPANVAGLIERSCYDCHSVNTVWPWYSKIAPMSWLVIYDVNTGRKHLNFSRWKDYSTMIRIAKLRLVCNTLETGKMPPKKYTMIHRNAKLSKEDIDALCKWAEEQIKILKDE